MRKTHNLVYTTLVLLLIAFITACGSGSSANENSPTPTTPESSALQSPSPEPTPTQVASTPPTQMPSPQPTSTPEHKEKRTDKNLLSPRKRPIAIMVENHPDARPQSGLINADVIYEAPAEFGIPRFMAIFVNKESKIVGPIRSARTYYVSWASEYNPVYVHAGGSPQGIRLIDQLGLQHIDALRYYAPQAFWRSTDRDAPHNLYGSTTEIRKLIAKDKNLQGKKGTWGPIHWSNNPTIGSESGKEVSVTYAEGYQASFKYDPQTGLYNRYMVGKPHLDRETKRQIAASAVIVQTVDMWQIKGDAYGRREVDLTNASGPILVFQNGKVLKGKWEKEDVDTVTKYETNDGKPIELKPGQVWIEIVPKEGSKIDYR